MTHLKETDSSSPWQTEDIRATNRSRRWRTPMIGFQSLGLILLDTSMIFASWTVAARIGTPTGVNISESTIPILAASIGTLAAAGFYGTDDKLHRFAKLFKSLILAQIIVLIAVFFYQPGLWVSRSVFSIALVLNFLFIGSARFVSDLCAIQMRKHNPIFQQPIVLMGDRVRVNALKSYVIKNSEKQGMKLRCKNHELVSSR